MRQKYDVYIAGKPLQFLDPSSDAHHEPDFPVVEVGSAADLNAAIERLASERVKGVQLLPVNEFDAWSAFKDMHKFVQAAGGMVSDEGGRLLAIRRLGVWDLPKGKVEKSEDIEQAAVREVQEECGLVDVRLVAPLTSTWHTYERKGKQHLKRTDWFLMKASSVEMLTAQTEEDIEEVRWMDRTELQAMKADTYPSLLPVIIAWEGR